MSRKLGKKLGHEFWSWSNTQHALKKWVKHANHWGHAPKCSHQSWAVTWFGQLEPWVFSSSFWVWFLESEPEFFQNKFGEKWFGTGGWLAANCSRTGTGTESAFQNLNLILFFQELDHFFLWNLNWIQFIFLKNWNQSFFIQDKELPNIGSH